MLPELHPLPLPEETGGVGVWTAELTVDPNRESTLRGFLSPAERLRAERFHFDRDRHRYVVARGLLRELLGERLGLLPGAVSFRVGTHGKPSLEGDEELRFNVSHSGDRALLAVADDGREIGVDLESATRLGDARDLPALAARTLCPEDFAHWRTLPGHKQQTTAFLRAWTRLEAYGKATGDGLGNVLGTISTRIEVDGAGARWLTEEPGWRGWDLVVGEGWAGALVVGSRPG